VRRRAPDVYRSRDLYGELTGTDAAMLGRRVVCGNEPRPVDAVAPAPYQHGLGRELDVAAGARIAVDDSLDRGR
jgi:hypothetical protein